MYKLDKKARKVNEFFAENFTPDCNGASCEAMERKRNREKPVAPGKLRSEFLKMEIFRLFLVQNHSKLRFFLADK